MTLKQRLSSHLNELYSAFTSARGREVGLFLLFSWNFIYILALLTLNNEMQRDVDVPVAIYNVPDSVTVLSDIPASIKVSLRDKGSVFLRNKLSGTKTLRIDWPEYVGNTPDNTFRMTKAELAARMRENFALIEEAWEEDDTAELFLTKNDLWSHPGFREPDPESGIGRKRAEKWSSSIRSHFIAVFYWKLICPEAERPGRLSGRF